jgi:hypothetical protein
LINDSKSWNLKNGFIEETEMVLELEGWMTNDAIWNSVKNGNEPKLTLENWIVNDSIWE